MAARLLQAFDVASTDVREQFINAIAERLGDGELHCLQAALQRLERRFDILCGVSKTSGARLPHEIQLQVFDFLDITDVYYCTNVCRRWRWLLLQCEQLKGDLLRRWFPALLDDGCKSPQQSHQLIRRRHLRDTGRFRSRFTCGFVKDSNGLFPVDRIEGLQRGRMFRDLACAVSLRSGPPSSTQARIGASYPVGSASQSTPSFCATSRETPVHSVSKYLYAHGRLAWQLTPASGEWVNPILVHDFKSHERWDLCLPSMRTRGISLVLWALGRDLVVAGASGERVLYAWDLVSHTCDRITLQNPPSQCFTKHRSVVIVTQRGDLLLWSFGHGLVNIDTAMPPDKGECRGPEEPEYTPRAVGPLPAYEIVDSKVMFHPTDEDVFFVVSYDERVDGPEMLVLLWVYEFRNRRFCQKFTYRVPPERLYGKLAVFGGYFCAQEVDGHGTYQLLEQKNRDDCVHVGVVTFNTLSRSFGTLKFQAPANAPLVISLVWNGQLVFGGEPCDASLHRSGVRPYPLMAFRQPPSSPGPASHSDNLFKNQTLESITGIMLTSFMSPKHVDSNATRDTIDSLEQQTPTCDIIRASAVSTWRLGGDIGLRYMLSFFRRQCNLEGLHAEGCPGSSGPQSAGGVLYPLNYFAQGNSPIHCDRSARAIFGDDDFIVVVNSGNFYTVFAVDEDGNIAETIRDSALGHAKGTSPSALEATG